MDHFNDISCALFTKNKYYYVGKIKHLLFTFHHSSTFDSVEFPRRNECERVESWNELKSELSHK